MSISEPIVLGIESALGGGSISLCRGTEEIASWIGEEGKTRAEDLLPNIARMLAECSLTLRDLDALAIATGPGSFTGIRIGISTVLGLRAGTGIRCLGLTSLAAMAGLAKSSSILVVPVGGQFHCMQRFGVGSNGSPTLVEFNAIGDEIRATGVSMIIAHGSIAEHIGTNVAGDVAVIDAGLNIARLVALAAFGEFASEDLTPLFLDRNRFIATHKA